MLGSVVLLLQFHTAHAAEPYVSFGIGYTGEEFNATTTGVNHPTRCDSLLYANFQDAPTDTACTDSAPRQMFGGSFGLGDAFVGTASFGLELDRVRIEAEFLGRSHSGAAVPAINVADNPALVSKVSEWSTDSPPRYRVSDFSIHQLFVNAHFGFASGTNWRPYVGAGIGFARVAMDYSGSYLRRTVAEGYVAAAGGDPAQAAEWQLAAAGTFSLLEVEVNDWAFGYQFLAGIERVLGERATLFAAARWTRLAELDSDDLWTTVRSHAPVQADGSTPFRTDQTFDEIGSFAVTGGLRYAF